MNQSVALSCLRVAKSLLMSHRGGTVGSLALIEVNGRTLMHDNAKQLGLDDGDGGGDDDGYGVWENTSSAVN